MKHGEITIVHAHLFVSDVLLAQKWEQISQS